MNSPGRTCVHSTPEASTARSTGRWKESSSPKVTAPDDSVTIRRTPALTASRTTSSALSGTGNRNIASTPDSGRVPGSARSPRTSPGADGAERVSASTSCPASPFSTSLPTFPLAPVTRIFMSPLPSRRCGSPRR
ncbi:hypothetical protein [Nonomuraea dietziae]|uniref:hypothetical protein n=1 Tax=Nonomuraea dietziae TaxID=65515 RepID=UPI0031D4DCBB